MTDSVPAQIDDYAIGERLGAGGFGTVFRATHRKLGRAVAIKILHSHRCHDADAVARFIDEARAANRIQHPAIVRVEGFGRLDDGRHYLAMELVAAESLRAILDRRGALPIDEALPLLHQLASVVDAAHAAGIAHRDLKPENVLVCDDESIRLIDFGIAKLNADSRITQTGDVLGSPRYMSPEQCRGRGGNARADLYSFGALAYHVLTGAPPFEGDALALALAHLNERPAAPSSRRPELTPAIDHVLGRLLAKEPSARPRPLVDAVEQLVIPRPRRPRVWPLIAIGALAAVAVVHFVQRDAGDERDARDAPVAPIAPIAPIDPPAVVRAPEPPRPLRAHATPFDLKFTTDLPFWLGPGGTTMTLANEHEKLDYRDGAMTPYIYGGEYRSLFPAGRELSSGHNGPDTHIWLHDLDDSWKMILRGMWAEVCPTGQRISLVRDNALWSVDANGGDPVELGPIRANAVGRWNPSCTQALVWGAMAGKGRFWLPHQDPLPPVFNADNTMSPGAFVRDDAIVYCDLDGALSAHQLGRAPDLRLAPPLGREWSCSVAGVVGHAVVNAHATRRQAGLIAGHRMVTPVDKQRFAAAFPDEHTMITVEPGVPRTLQRVDLATGAETALAACSGEVALVMQKGKLLHVVRDETAFTFLDDNCQSVATYPLRDGIGWSDPACAGTTCVTAVLWGDVVRLYRLEPSGMVLLGEGPRHGPSMTPVAAISPDGTHAVATLAAESAVYVFDVVAAKRVGEIELKAGEVQSLAWTGDNARFAMAGRDLDGHAWGVHLVSLDGRRRYLDGTGASEGERCVALGPTSPRGALTCNWLSSPSRWFRVDTD